jgi:hypothetical protein
VPEVEKSYEKELDATLKEFKKLTLKKKNQTNFAEVPEKISFPEEEVKVL